MARRGGEAVGPPRTYDRAVMTAPATLFPSTPAPEHGERVAKLLEGLNPQQRAAVVARRRAAADRRRAPARARPGCSPTASPTCWPRAARQPGEILAITFTNKAAGEMKERVAALVGGRARAMWVSTFHSACVRILRARGQAARASRRSFSIYDAADSPAADDAGLPRPRPRPEALSRRGRSPTRSAT